MQDRAKHERRVGTVVDGKWRIDALLGSGSTSAVYRATHRNGHSAALKILHQSLCADRVASLRFIREAQIANAIAHPAIVRVRDDGITEEGCAYLILELLEGETFEARRLRAGGHVALADLAPIADELMDALEAVHAAGVVHRDLKPQNVFLTKNGELKLLDFGTARIRDTSAGESISVQGLVIGTPSFMSPEQARGQRDQVDAVSDVWSLGATLFTMLSGELVHVGRDAHARLLAAGSKPARSLAAVAPSLEAPLVALVDRALAFEKNDRWPDVATMRAAFREIAPAASRAPTASEEATEATIETLQTLQTIETIEATGGRLVTPMTSVKPVGLPTPASPESPTSPDPLDSSSSLPPMLRPSVPPPPSARARPPLRRETSLVANVTFAAIGLGILGGLGVVLAVYLEDDDVRPRAAAAAAAPATPSPGPAAIVTEAAPAPAPAPADPPPAARVDAPRATTPAVPKTKTASAPAAASPAAPSTATASRDAGATAPLAKEEGAASPAQPAPAPPPPLPETPPPVDMPPP